MRSVTPTLSIMVHGSAGHQYNTNNPQGSWYRLSLILSKKPCPSHTEPVASGIQIGAGGAKTGHFLIRLF